VLTGVLHRESLPAALSPAATGARFDPTPFDLPAVGDKEAYFAGRIRLRCGRLDIANRSQSPDTIVAAVSCGKRSRALPHDKFITQLNLFFSAAIFTK